MERKIKEPGNNPPVATEDQIKSIIQKYLPQFLKELESSAPDLQTFSSAQGFEHREDTLKNSTSKDTNLIERVVRVEEGLKALRDHVDIRFEESRNHTDLRFEEIKHQIEETKQQIKGSNRYVAFATGIATALVLLAITLSRVL